MRLFLPQPTLERGEELSAKIYEKSTYTPWKHKPNSEDRMISPYGEFNIPVRINSYGLRGENYNLKKAKNVTRIIFLGDSFTYGVGVTLENTYSKKLENILNKRKNANYEAINMGFADGGYTTDIHYLYLKEKGLDFSPDAVFLGLFIGNDISDLNRNTWVKNNSNRFPENITSEYHYVDDKNRLRIYYENESYYEKYRTLGKVNYFLSKKSHLFVLFKNFVIRKTYQPEKIFLERIPEDSMSNINKIEALIKEMKKISGENNALFIVVIIPPKTQVWDSEWQKYHQIYKNLYPSRNMPQKLFMDFCESNNVTCINLLPKFFGKANEGGLYYPIDGHWDEKGHQLAADIIYKELAKENILNKTLNHGYNT